MTDLLDKKNAEEQTAAEATPLVEDEGIAVAQPLAGDEENAPEKDAEREPIIKVVNLIPQIKIRITETLNFLGKWFGFRWFTI